MSRPDLDELRAAIEAADLRVLLMSLLHITGDRRWIQAPFLPKRDVRLVANLDAGLKPEAQLEVRSKIFDLMTQWIERYRQQAEARYRRLDDVLRSMPDAAPAPSPTRKEGTPS